MGRRTESLEFAVLGLLGDAPLHGYELRKRLNVMLGSFRALSYGTLYPALKHMVAAGFISQTDEPPAITKPLAGRRARIVYRLTAAGRARFAELLSDVSPATWEDEQFGVHLNFFARTSTETRLRILEGRRARLEERLAMIEKSLELTRERLDGYGLALQEHSKDSVQREVLWIDRLIDSERRGGDSRTHTAQHG